MGGLATASSLVPSLTTASSDGSNVKNNTGSLGDKLTVKNNKVVVDSSVSTGSAFSSNNEYTIRDIAEIINRGVRDGFWNALKSGGEIQLKLTSLGERKINRAISSYVQTSSTAISTQATCGVSKYTDNAVYLNHEDTETVAEALGDTADAVQLAGVIFAALGGVAGGIIGAIPGVIVAAAGFLLDNFTGDLTLIDDGCGVIIEGYQFVTWDVVAQDCNC